ncbi:hypothetical protein ACWDR0_10230 [Streptomyces sp. NPDC003691]
MTLTLEELIAPQEGPPSEDCPPCKTVRDAIREKSAKGDMDGVIAAQGFRELHEAQAHVSPGRAAAREPAPKKRVTRDGRNVRRTPEEMEAAKAAVHRARETITRRYLDKVPLGVLAADYGVTHKWLRTTLESWEVPIRGRSAVTQAARTAY